MICVDRVIGPLCQSNFSMKGTLEKRNWSYNWESELGHLGTITPVRTTSVTMCTSDIPVGKPLVSNVPGGDILSSTLLIFVFRGLIQTVEVAGTCTS